MGIGLSRKVFLVMMGFLLGIGAIGFFYSLNLPAYKDEDFYHSQYMSIAFDPSPKEASKQFHILRDSQLTSKYKVQDYSLTVFSIGLVLLFFLKAGGTNITSFNSKKKIFFLGVFSALITSCGFFSSLMLDYHRGEFPWWADSLGIPIFTQDVPMFLALLGWAIIHSLFVSGKFECGKTVFKLGVLKSNYWLSFITVISLLFLLASIVYGSFTMVIPGCLWIYFYLSLAAGRTKSI